MKNRFHIATAIATALVLLSGVASQAARYSLDEDAALGWLVRTLKHNHVYAKRISLDCITYDTEQTTDAYFQFALREKHDAKCGGDPETSPVVDRYRVYRHSSKIERWEAADDTWHIYKGAQTK
jgi:hypothetical protein